MPLVTIQITDEGVTPTQKAALIQGATELLQRVLDKNPATTMVLIDELPLANWGIGGLPVEIYRQQHR
ncbi:4-oxalocrotonate tautomerase family protein [Halioxenophilus sp. WMMB6]|uniref:tautomerase family protein n=1 Tax=Halioxenophilus sp. WMMB6 TaxID=3073815 RepID=UPI00295EA3E7|nr:4-oxalocrotonate tautomerase family protein [Halioxenophilus sp. WMMB6]